MNRLPGLLLLLFLGLCWQTPARASGDFECTPSWKLAHTTLSDCDNMAIIGPGNDSRVNLMLLLADRQQVPMAATGKPLVFFDLAMVQDLVAPRPKEEEQQSRFSEGEGSRCRSNAAGTASFEQAIGRNRGVADKERALLVEARKALQPDCAVEAKLSATLTHVLNGVSSPAGREFGAYLEGAAAFYAADYDLATARFSALRSARDGWLRETAHYMAGRVEVNRAQLDYYDEYGSPKEGMKIDPKVISAAEGALREYMKVYPKGVYFGSARGLLRRVYWLAGDVKRLEAEYAALMAMTPAARGMDDAALTQEIDAKLLATAKPEQLSDPLLLAALDLMRMRVERNEDGSTCCGEPLSRQALETQRGKFAKMPALFDLLLAAHATFVEGKSAGVLTLIPDASHQKSFTYLEFSRQMLRGMALETKRDVNARAFWIDLLAGSLRVYQRPAVELAIALHDERAKMLARLFEPGSPIRTAAIREILLINVAGPALLRQQATGTGVPQHEREVALFVLLYKGATRGRNSDFVRDVALVAKDAPHDIGYYDLVDGERAPTGVFTQTEALGDYGCPVLRETQGRLAANPADARAILCLGDFMRTTGFDDTELDAQPRADELGGTPTLFPGKPYSRLEAYRGVIASPRTHAEDKAYALYRAIRCYAPSRNNSCGGEGVNEGQRKAWFQQIKRDYPQTRWAKDLQYYW
ncbi:hypothetical protein BH10PSE13_BH10PSE13_22300 [soil metagenome]